MQTGNMAKTDTKEMPVDEKNISGGAKEDIATSNPAIAAKFSAMFPAATSAQWSSTKDNLWVSFVHNGRKGSASFTPQGKVNYVIVDCAMEQLPKAFGASIKKDYPLYSVYNAVEIKAHDAVAYQVVLENPVSFITLKYTSQGVEEIQRVKK
jgi:hypothetical protein